MFHRFLAGLVVCLCGAGVVGGADWAAFRGPEQGRLNGALPTTWAKNRNVKWKQDVPGAGWSSPIIVGERIYLTTAVPVTSGGTTNQSLRVLCLSVADGKPIWDKEVFLQDGKKSPRIHSKGTHANPTPLWDGERLYVHFGHQGTACLTADGAVLWRNSKLKYQPVHGNGGSPILVGDALIYSADGSDQQFVAALSRKTGEVLWKTDRKSKAPKKFSFCTPLLIQVNGKNQVVSPGSNVVAAFDPENGKEIWRVRYEGYSVVPQPIFGHGMIFLSTGFDSPKLLAIRADGQGDVTDTHVAWTLADGAPLTPSPLLIGDDLYLISDRGVASCLEARTGKQFWQKKLGGAFSASPLFADGKIYLQNERGLGIVIKAGRQFEEVARNDLGEPTLASAAAIPGALFLRTKTHLYCIREK